MIRKPLIYFHRNRHLFLTVVVFIVAAALMARLMYLATIERKFLQSQGNARTLRVVSIPAYRGMITDRYGEPLAISSPVDAIWVNPQTFQPNATQLQRLAKILNLDIEQLQERIKQASDREFLYLARGVNPAVGEQVKALQIPDIYFQREFRRFYPEGAVTAHLIGFTNIDDQGQEGLELLYNQWLQGAAGKRRVLKDRYGNIVEDLGTLQQPSPGHDLVLSIDRRLQYLAYRELAQGLEHFKASSGSVVVLDVNTNEVLAMVNLPSFNPNQRPFSAHNEQLRNRAVTDIFEPGSVIKPFSVLAALEHGKIKPTSLIDTERGMIKIDDNIVRDISRHGVLSVTDVLRYSSNVGVTKIALMLPGEQLWELLRRVGFGQSTGSLFPGEREGSLAPRPKWSPFIQATLAFGYGIAVTPLQLAQAYAIFASGGIKRPVSLLKLDPKALAPEQKGVRVIDAEVARTMVEMLTHVVEDGSGSAARVKGYWVAGKTGTARLLGKNGYQEKRHIASFVGMAPASHPRLVIAVVINDPQASAYYASQVAAPVFSSIMAGALNLLNIPPDNMAPINPVINQDDDPAL